VDLACLMEKGITVVPSMGLPIIIMLPFVGEDIEKILFDSFVGEKGENGPEADFCGE
jgi:hypothetical protein